MRPVPRRAPSSSPARGRLRPPRLPRPTTSRMCSRWRGCGRTTRLASRSFRVARSRGGAPRARSHCRFAPPRFHFTPYSLTYSVPLFLKRKFDRTLGTPEAQAGGGGAVRSHCCFASPPALFIPPNATPPMSPVRVISDATCARRAGFLAHMRHVVRADPSDRAKRLGASLAETAARPAPRRRAGRG